MSSPDAQTLMVLQRIANGRVRTKNKTTSMRLHEAVFLAREECDRLGLRYDERTVGIGPKGEERDDCCVSFAMAGRLAEIEDAGQLCPVQAAEVGAVDEPRGRVVPDDGRHHLREGA